MDRRHPRHHLGRESVVRRGEIRWVAFPAGAGGEIRKRRPAVIVSNDAANAILNRIQVIPLTSNVSRVYRSETLIMVGERPSKAMADQIATIAKEMVGPRLGIATEEEMRRLATIIAYQLALV